MENKYKRLQRSPKPLLSSASALGLGVGLLGSSVTQADDLQTIVPPQFYQQTDDGQVVLATTDGKPIILNEGQYLILEDGLLIITDELAQNTLNGLSVLGSFRSSDFSFPDPVYSSSGDIIETASDQPLWSGDRPTFQSLGIETYELAQQTEEQSESETAFNGSGLSNAGLGAGFGFGLMGLINGFFDNGSSEEIPSETTSQETPRIGAKGFVIPGIDASDFSGHAVSSAGDINNDGFDDIIIGAHFSDPNGNESGESYVVFGKQTGYSTSLDLSLLDGTNGFVINGIAAGDWSGYSVSSAGDINGDTYDDVVIGSFNADPNASEGESYVVFGKASGSYLASLDLSSLDGTNGFIIKGINAGDDSGYSVSSAGDINGDSYDDIIIGAKRADPNGNLSGESYVVFGKAAGSYTASLELSSLNGTNGFIINGTAAEDASGTSVSSAGDINGDTYDDIIIGAPGGDKSFIVFGKAAGTYSASLELSSLDGTSGFVINGSTAALGSGYSVSSAGDINGDTYDDIIIGDIGGDFVPAKSYVVFGKQTGYSTPLDLSSLDGTNGFVISDIDAGDRRHWVSTAGDVNADTFDDIIIGTYSADNYTGESYVILGTSGGYSASLDLSSLNGTNGFVINGNDAGDWFGRSVSSAGDLNGDNYDDLIIGAPQADGATGESYVVFGQSEFDAFVDLSDLGMMV